MCFQREEINKMQKERKKERKKEKLLEKVTSVQIG